MPIRTPSIPPLPMDNPTYTSHQPMQTSGGGSFGPVFIALTVIALLGVAACAAGRLCARYLPRAKERHDHRSKVAEAGAEVGYDMRIPVAKPAQTKASKDNPKADGNGATKTKVSHKHIEIQVTTGEIMHNSNK